PGVTARGRPVWRLGRAGVAVTVSDDGKVTTALGAAVGANERQRPSTTGNSIGELAPRAGGVRTRSPYLRPPGNSRPPELARGSAGRPSRSITAGGASATAELPSWIVTTRRPATSRSTSSCPLGQRTSIASAFSA